MNQTDLSFVNSQDEKFKFLFNTIYEKTTDLQKNAFNYHSSLIELRDFDGIINEEISNKAHKTITLIVTLLGDLESNTNEVKKNYENFRQEVISFVNGFEGTRGGILLSLNSIKSQLDSYDKTMNNSVQSILKYISDIKVEIITVKKKYNVASEWETFLAYKEETNTAIEQILMKINDLHYEFKILKNDIQLTKTDLPANYEIESKIGEMNQNNEKKEQKLKKNIEMIETNVNNTLNDFNTKLINFETIFQKKLSNTLELIKTMINK